MEKKQSFIDAITTGFGEAVADIRHKVVEEGYFGRETTKDSPAAQSSGFEAYLDQQFGKPTEAETQKSQERDQDLEK